MSSAIFDGQHGLTSPHGPALLALAAEVGHLGAALMEWPASTARGVLHVLAAAALGLVAAGAYFGSRRLARPAGIVIGGALLTGSTVAALTGVPLYRDFSFGTAVIGVEVVFVVFVAGTGTDPVVWANPAPAGPVQTTLRTRVQRRWTKTGLE